MKTFVIGVLVFGFGIVVGMGFSNHQFMGPTFRAMRSKDRYCVTVALLVFDKLQEGNIDKARSLLVSEIATYYKSIQKLDPSPEKQDLLHQIETSSNSSPELKNALGNKP